MASINHLVLGGLGSIGPKGLPYRSAISYSLRQSSSLNLVDTVDGWTIEIRKDCSVVVARSEESLSREAVVDVGTECIQRFLDVVSFERFIHIELEKVGDTHMVLYERDARYVLERYGTSDFSMKIEFNFAAYDKEGSEIPPPPQPPAKWLPALRFYRLSQSSGNLYEAYRNLWLGLETLLSALQPIARREKEGAWLRRALTHVAANVDLRPYVPANCGDVVDYLMGEQYVAMRCYLFHAKPDPTIGAPSIPSPEKATFAYAQLVRIWREIALRLLGARSVGGSAVTYAGFLHMMDRCFATGLAMECTEDQTPPSRGDTAVSPAGKPVIHFDEAEYKGEVTPGRVAIIGRLIVGKHGEIPLLHRIGATVQGNLFNIDYVDGGLDLTGVDLFENVQVIRLRNRELPRTQF